jgi:UDP-N-acetylmuramoylalanine--D-glutamate ligase
MKQVAVIGLGKSGLSAAAFLQKEGYRVWAVDDKLTVAPEGIRLVSVDEVPLQDIEFVVISPGVPLTHPLAQKARCEVFCDVELAFRRIKKNHPMVGITGSNGKTTTTSLTAHLLSSCGRPAKPVGNIGTPILSELDAPETLVVELSSFQLETMRTKVLDAACVLNITPNHLDRHKTMDAYSMAKLRIGMCVRDEGAFWVEQGIQIHKKALRFGFDSTCDLYTDGKKLVRMGVEEGMMPDSLQDSRNHNVQNFLAAYALTRHYGVDPLACIAAYESFIRPRHRLQYVKTHRGIAFYNDSKATSVEAVLRAIDSIQTPIVLIAGGRHKGYPYIDWQKPFKDKVRACILIGEAADLIELDLAGHVPLQHADSLQDALQKAILAARPNDAVLLSPGCSSYDMFSNFEERGDRFVQLVESLT